jgi:nicotinamidase-related amidase
MARSELLLHLRTQEPTTNDRGWAEWRVVETEKRVAAEKTAIIICDMWDNHWARGAAERVDAMAPRMNEVVKAAREKGATIIHAPSDVIEFYADHIARRRISGFDPVTPPESREHADPPLPIDDSDGGSDTGETPWHKAWTRQHPAIEILDSDYISDRGAEIYSLLRRTNMAQALIMGVHTGMCVLHRSFGIKQMVRWGVPIALVRDLTDAMYNPARSPYVSHDEGTRLIVEFIEKFWCPTVGSEDVAMRGLCPDSPPGR